MVIGTDPDRLEVTLRHFLERNTGRIPWLNNGDRLFEGTCGDFRRERSATCDNIPELQSSSDKEFLHAVRMA